MKKAWLIFALVLVVSTQLVVLSSFHDVEVNTFASGNSVVGVYKWDYVQGSLYVSIMPIPLNGSSSVRLVFPNGTAISIGSSGYSFLFPLPRTGDVLGNGAISGPLAISQSQPLNVTVFQSVGNVTSYVDNLEGVANQSLMPIDVYVLVVYGEAQVSVSGFGIGL